MTIGGSPVCLECKHYRGDNGLNCDAFPDGIPDAIIFGDKHKKPFPGDNGIRFEPKEKEKKKGITE